MKRKSFEIHAPNVTDSYFVNLGRRCRFPNERRQLNIEIVSKFSPTDVFILLDYPADIGLGKGVKFDPHYLRRLRISASNSSKEIAMLGSASISASRRSASVMPSSSSDSIGGSESSRFAANIARSLSGKSSASFSTSMTVAMRIGYSLKRLAIKQQSRLRQAPAGARSVRRFHLPSCGRQMEKVPQRSLR